MTDLVKSKKIKQLSVNLLYIFISLPKSNSKYYNYTEIQSQIKTIKLYRTIYKILIPIFITLIIIVFILDKNQLIK